MTRQDRATTATPTPGVRDAFRAVRDTTTRLFSPLSDEDMAAQASPDASPAKWHGAHTTWFFEEFVLSRFAPGYRPFDARFSYLFNSYYNAVGDRIARDRRSVLTRPSVADMLAYREHVDGAMDRLLVDPDPEAVPIVEIGLNHEQQHQELILTDIEHLLFLNPLRPAYDESCAAPAPGDTSARWVRFEEGVREIGHDAAGFAYDNESPRHRVFLEAFELSDRLVTCAEYERFIEDDGYARPELWLDAGWALAQEHAWCAPLGWRKLDAQRRVFTLGGERAVEPSEPVWHLSFYEADAYARWAGARLPTEAEWESAACATPVAGNLLDPARLCPGGAPEPNGSLRQLFGDVWEWTGTQYRPYPGYKPAGGALGEYNGKFMSNQFVLRGGSCYTPASHIRATYRNFWAPQTRWQMTGVRLARTV